MIISSCPWGNYSKGPWNCQLLTVRYLFLCCLFCMGNMGYFSTFSRLAWSSFHNEQTFSLSSNQIWLWPGEISLQVWGGWKGSSRKSIHPHQSGSIIPKNFVWKSRDGHIQIYNWIGEKCDVLSSHQWSLLLGGLHIFQCQFFLQFFKTSH